MRSVVVVLPASMWALMPMLRYRSMGVPRAMMFAIEQWIASFHCSLDPLLVGFRCLKPEVRERFVRFGHPVHFLALFHGAAAPFRRFEQFGRKSLAHRLLAALARCLAEPAHRERHPAHRTHFDGHLEVGAAH